MASLVRVSAPPRQKKNRIVFANPVSLPRNDLRVRLSYDEGKTWPVSKSLLEGPAGYSDMAAAPDGAIFILYEQSFHDGSGRTVRLLLSRFDLEWLTDGNDKFE
jgi:sialidase-1